MKKQGFSLVELSIVLVILGLLVGGFLSGQSLIKAATLRAQIAQIDSMRVAVSTFKDKYFAIPGDLSYTVAARLGFYAPTTGAPGALGLGDGNGIINCSYGATDGVFDGEPIMFWRHLTDAKLIEGFYGSGITTGGSIPSDLTTLGQINTYVPPAKIGRSASLSVMGDSGVNYLVVAGVGTISTSPINGAYTNGTNIMSSADAWGIDRKVDDGVSHTGSVTAINAAVSTFNNSCAFSRVCAGSIPNCVVGGFTGNYNLGTTEDAACSLSFRLTP